MLFPSEKFQFMSAGSSVPAMLGMFVDLPLPTPHGDEKEHRFLFQRKFFICQYNAHLTRNYWKIVELLKSNLIKKNKNIETPTAHTIISWPSNGMVMTLK